MSVIPDYFYRDQSANNTQAPSKRKHMILSSKTFKFHRRCRTASAVVCSLGGCILIM